MMAKLLNEEQEACLISLLLRSHNQIEEVKTMEKSKNLASEGQERLEIDIAFVGNSTTAYLTNVGKNSPTLLGGG